MPIRFSNAQQPTMSYPPEVLSVRSSCHDEMINITSQVQRVIPRTFTGGCLISSQHTTAGVTVNENADADVCHDILMGLNKVFPWDDADYDHGEGNSAAHLKTSFMGSSLVIPVAEGRMDLGTWQGIFFCEFDGPRSRRVTLQLLAAAVKRTGQ